MYLYFVIGHLARNDAEIVRLAGLLRGTEVNITCLEIYTEQMLTAKQSAAQAVSYGVSSIAVMGEVGCVYLNFGLWGISLLPAWLVIKEIGTKYSKLKREHEGVAAVGGVEEFEKPEKH